MTKQERLKYMRERFPKLEAMRKQSEADKVDAVLSVTKTDIQDEMSLNDGFRERRRENTEVLTSDEKA
jgi:hypothetical protein